MFIILLRAVIVHVAVVVILINFHDLTERQNVEKLVLSSTDVNLDLVEASLPTTSDEVLFVEIEADGLQDKKSDLDIMLLDTDGDGLTDHEERAIYQTFWYDTDTDNDGIDDNTEVLNGDSPKQPGLTMKQADTDGDGLNDAWEIKLGTNLMVRDSDGDGYLDSTEVYHGFSPTNTEAVLIDKKIIVSDEALNLKFYFGDIMLSDLPVSTGKKSTPTPKGEFEILARVPVKHYGGEGFDFSYPNTKWNLHFTTDYWRYYIHSAYWHDNFGEQPVSGGCINVREEDMEDLYNFANEGTKVIIS
jgi:hypothetical protein